MEQQRKKRSALKLVTRKSSKMLGRWRKLDSVDRSDGENISETKPVTVHRIFGGDLRHTVMLNPSLDGLPLPAFFRNAIDFIEKEGLCLEGIYRISSPKSRLDELERLVNELHAVTFNDGHEAAGLIKRFLRQLPTRLLPEEFDQIAEACKCEWMTACTCGASRRIKEEIKALDRSSYYLLAFTILHAQNVINKECDNKMGLPALGLLLQTVMDMSRYLICILIMNASDLLTGPNPKATFFFSDVQIIPYVLPKSRNEVEGWKCEDKPLLEEELKKQETLLEHLHYKLENKMGEQTVIEDELWNVQAVITLLKRRIKAVAEPITTGEEKPCAEMYDEKQLMAVQSSLREDIASERQRITAALWRLMELSSTEEQKVEEEKAGSSEEISEDWKDDCQLEESARSALVTEITRLRNDCALMRSKIEIYQHNSNAITTTRF